MVDKLLDGGEFIYAETGTLHAAQSFPPLVSSENQIKIIKGKWSVMEYFSGYCDINTEVLRVIVERIEQKYKGEVIGPSNFSHRTMCNVIKHPNLPPDLQLHFAKNYGEWVQDSLARKVYKEPSDEAIDLIIQRCDLTFAFRDRFRSRIAEYTQAANELFEGIKGFKFRVPAP